MVKQHIQTLQFNGGDLIDLNSTGVKDILKVPFYKCRVSDFRVSMVGTDANGGTVQLRSYASFETAGAPTVLATVTVPASNQSGNVLNDSAMSNDLFLSSDQAIDVNVSAESFGGATNAYIEIELEYYSEVSGNVSIVGA